MRTWAHRSAVHWGRFAVWLLVVFAVRELLNRHRFDPVRDRLSAEITVGGACVIAVSVLIMLAETTQWTLRRLGVFGLIALDCLVYGSLGAGVLWGVHLSQENLNWLRALMLVSASLLLVSQIRYLSGGARERWGTRKEAP